jgi:drug/metabolite transporter (DMT)-like permease
VPTDPASTSPAPDDHRRKAILGVACTLAGGACWGFSGTCAKFLMTSYGVDPLWLVCVREMGSFWMFLLVAWFTNRESLLAVPRSPRAAGEVVVVAILAILMSQVGYIESIAWTNSATATVLQSLNLLLIMGYVCVRNHRGPRGREVVGMLFALVGTYLIATGGNPGQLQLPVGGLGWVAMMILAAALLAIVPRRALARWGSFVVNGYSMLVSGVVLSLVVRPWEHMPVLDAAGWAWIVVIVVVGTFGAYALFLQGVKEIGSLKAGLLGTIEPVTATVLSVVWMGTVFTPVDLVGFALIIAMVYLTV